jgi:DHA1 family bicyclomycin/chloramphenicol resistance-like MFS transporter
MKNLKESHKGFSTLLALALIPLSGFATDIYLPSLPAMAKDLNVSAGAIQLSLVFFMFSLGVSQIFIGSILDSFGRFKSVLLH